MTTLNAEFASLPQINPLRFSPKDSRVWIKFTLPKSRVVNDLLDAIDAISGNSNTRVFLESVFDVFNAPFSFYLPLSGTIPIYQFNHSYDRLMGELGLTQRFLLGLAGSAIRHAGTGVGGLNAKLENWLGDAFSSFGGNALVQGIAKMAGHVGSGLKAVGGGIETFGRFAEKFQGSMDSKQVWTGAEPLAFSVAGGTGIDTKDEWNYYKACEIISLLMTTPREAGRVTFLNDFINSIECFSDLSPNFRNAMEMTSFAVPLNGCKVEIVIGQAQAITEKNKNIQLYVNNIKDQIVLFTVDDCYLNTAKFTYGADDGKGIDNFGFGHIVTYEFGLKPMDIASVIRGISKSMESWTDTSNAVKMEIGQTSTTKTDFLDALLYTTFNSNLIATGYEYRAKRIMLSALGMPFLIQSQSPLAYSYAHLIKQE